MRESTIDVSADREQLIRSAAVKAKNSYNYAFCKNQRLQRLSLQLQASRRTCDLDEAQRGLRPKEAKA